MDSVPITAHTRDLLVSQLSQSERITESAFQIALAASREARRRGLELETRMLELSAFNHLLMQDVHWLMDDLVHADATPRSLLYSKTLLGTIYEGLRKYQHLLGRQFRADLRELDLLEQFLDLADSAHNGFHVLFERCNQDLKEVRDGIVAHRDASVEKQLALTDKIHPEDAAALACDFMRSCAQLYRVLALASHRILELTITKSLRTPQSLHPGGGLDDVHTPYHDIAPKQPID